MTRALAFLPGTGLGRYYSSAAIPSWEAGQVREVPDHVAGYLTSTFPDAFVEHHDPAAVDRQPAVSAPSTAPAPTKKATTPRTRGKG